MREGLSVSHVFMIVPIMVELGELRPGGPAQYAEFVLFAGSLEPLQIDLYGGLKFALFTRAREPRARRAGIAKNLSNPVAVVRRSGGPQLRLRKHK